MGKMKSIYAMANMLSAMTALKYEREKEFLLDNSLTENEEERAERMRLFEIENRKRKGLKLFNIDGKEVWALNEKVAIKKSKRYD